MADNPFAQYAPKSEAAANPFAQYAPTASAGEIPTARRSYALSQVPGAMVENAPASAGQFVGGMVQAVTSPIQTLTGILDLGAGALRNALPKSVSGFIDKFDADPAAAERASAVATAVGGVYKDKYGDYESIKRTFAEDPVGAVGDLSTLLTGGAGIVKNAPAVTAGALSKVAPSTARAVAGAIPAAEAIAAPVARAGQLTNVARPFAPLIEVPVKLAGKAAGAVYNAFDPKSVAYLTAAEGRGPEIVNALRGQTEIVPGSMPTAAEAASSVGATRFSAMGASAAKTTPTPYFERGQGNKAAQLAATQTVGKTPAELKAAEAARSSTAKELYGIADEALVPADKIFTGLLNRPSMDKVLARASNLAAEKDIPFQIGQNRPAQSIPSSILDAEGKPMGVTNIPGEVAKYPGSSLHMMKVAFDDLIKNPERFGIGAAEAQAIGKTRGEFLKWAEAKAPDYKTARETFAAQSKPINQMQVGQYLEGKLKPALETTGGETPAALKAATFANAMEQAPQTIKKSTGMTRFDELSQVLTPDQVKTLESVRADLARAKLTEAQAAAARGAGPEVNLMGTETLGSVRAPNFINNVTTVANDILRRLQGKLDQKLAIELAAEMLDPAAAAAALEKAMAREARGQKLSDPFKKTGKAASNIIRTPAAINMLAPTSEVQNAFVGQ
jgi:hypothetical protein